MERPERPVFFSINSQKFLVSQHAQGTLIAPGRTSTQDIPNRLSIWPRREFQEPQLHRVISAPFWRCGRGTCPAHEGQRHQFQDGRGYVPTWTELRPPRVRLPISNYLPTRVDFHANRERDPSVFITSVALGDCVLAPCLITASRNIDLCEGWSVRNDLHEKPVEHIVILLQPLELLLSTSCRICISYQKSRLLSE